MQETGIKKMVFSSTAAVYAPISQGVLTEESPTRSENPYSFSKYAVERLIEDFSAAAASPVEHLLP